jgi:Spy/CpxP family protein refolding chaperone
MKRLRAVTVLALLALAILPVLAQQEQPPPGPPPPRGPYLMPLEFVLRTIDLTPEQSAQIDPLMKARRDAADAARPAAEAAARSLAEQVRAGTFDEAAIRGKAAAVAPFDADRAVADAALLRDIRAVLSPEQLEKFDRLLEPPPLPPAGGGIEIACPGASTGRTTRSVALKSR